MIPFIHIGPLEIPTFGLMVALAMLGAYYILRADLARRGLATNDSTLPEKFIAIPCLAGIVGAKLYHVLETPRELLAHPAQELFSRYGLAWFGGLIAGFAAFVLLARHEEIPLLDIFDAGSPAAALGYGIGRIGCLLSGDGDYGTPTSLPWGMSFPNGLVPTTQRVHPTPIYEFIVACIIAWILWKIGSVQLATGSIDESFPLLERENARVHVPILGKISSRHIFFTAPYRSLERFSRPGRVFAAYLILTGIARFLVEFIRINPRSFFGLTNAQAASLASIIAGIILWAAISRRQTNREQFS